MVGGSTGIVDAARRYHARRYWQVTVLQHTTNNETSSETNQSPTYGETYERKSIMTLDKEYYEKALVILQSKWFSDKEADQVATTLVVFLPMRFKASAWEEIPPEQRPENTLAAIALGWYYRIPEMHKPSIHKMPTDLTLTTYGQAYIPDSPAFTTTADGYTRAPFDWEGGIAGEPDTPGDDDVVIEGRYRFVLNEVKFLESAEQKPDPSKKVVRMADCKNVEDVSLVDFVAMVKGDRELTDAQKRFVKLWKDYHSDYDGEVIDALSQHAQQTIAWDMSKIQQQRGVIESQANYPQA
ncbi:hypothetical protein ACTFIV_005182 [Dictyostelium citrinum]